MSKHIIEIKVYFICKECYPHTNKTYDSMEALLFNHPILKNQPQLIGVLIEIEKTLLIW